MKRRTREQKIIAGLRKQLRQTEVETAAKSTLQYKPQNNYVATNVSRTLDLPKSEMTRDIAKTFGVALLILALQFGLAMYLNQGGGWGVITNLKLF